MLLLRDLSDHGVIRATGPDRVRFLNGMLTNDVAKLPAGAGLHAAMLTVKGKLLGDMLVLADEDALLVDVVGSARAKVREAFERHLIVDDVLLEDEAAPLGLLGEEAQAALAAALGVPEAELPAERYGHRRFPGASPAGPAGSDAVRVVRVAELGLPGFRVYGAGPALGERLAAAGARPLGEGEAEARRVAVGEPRYGVDMGEDQLPMEARLDDAVSLTKGCYMGQEVIARLTARGHINRKLVGLRLDGEAPAPAGAKVSALGRDEAGQVTSSVRWPGLGVIALAYLHRSLWTPGTEVVVHAEGGPRPATVAELPFA